MRATVVFLDGFVVFLATALAACGGGGAGPDAAADATTSPDAPTATDAARSPDAGGCGSLPPLTETDPASTPEVTIVGDTGSTLGVFDPSLVYPAGAPGGAMSYSSVPDAHSIRTRIAVSGDAGATWTFVAEANTPVAATITSSDPTTCPGGTCSGFFINEVSSLVIDPTDPDARRRWKLFTHRYLVGADNTLYYAYGTIALSTAPAPEGPWSAPAAALGWSSTSPASSDGALTNVSDIPELADCVALTEPGAVWRPAAGGGPDAIDLAVGCASLATGQPRIRIALLRSTDHAATFHFVSTLLDGGDAACAQPGAISANAADLFFAGGVEYLSATPGLDGGGYRGCEIYAIDDPDAGAVRRDAGGDAVVLRRLGAPADRFNGACTYAEGATAAGYLQPTLFLDQPPRVFRILRTGAAAP